VRWQDYRAAHHKKKYVLDLRDQILLGRSPAAGVTGVDAVREGTFLSPSFSALFSISIEPLKYADGLRV